MPSRHGSVADDGAGSRPSGVDHERDDRIQSWLLDGADVIASQSETGRYRVAFDPRRVRPSEVVVCAVATVENVAPVDLDPLYDTVDPDALDALFAGTGEGGLCRANGRVTFAFESREVTLHAHGVVEVESDAAPADE